MLDVLFMIMGLLIVAAIFLIGILCFIIAIQEKTYLFILPSIAAFVLGIFLIILCPLNPSSPLNTADDLKDGAIEAYKAGDKIFDLDKYDIKVEDGTVYLIPK